MSIATPILIYSLSLGADAGSTLYARRQPGVIEANPLMRNRAVMIGSHIASAAALTYIDTRLQRRSKCAPWVLRGAVLVAGGFVARHNLQQVRRTR